MIYLFCKCEMSCGHNRQILFHILIYLKYFTIRKDYITSRKRYFIKIIRRMINMKENKLIDLSTDFAVNIIKLCEEIKGHYSIVNQLERSATSIGANIREANYAQSKPDFISKLQIALKECYETEYWLELFVKSDIIEKEMLNGLDNQCGTIRRILISSINTAKANSTK